MDLGFQRDYEGFAKANNETLEALTKALTAGSGVDAGAFTGGRALTLESMDTTLVNVLHSTDEARLFQKLKKQPVKSVVHQWDERTEVGHDESAWVAEAGDSYETDQTIARKYTTAKYLQTLRKVSLQAASSDMIENAIALEKQAGMLWLIRNVEKGLFYANSAYVGVQPDGLNAQLTTNVLDVRGVDATTKSFEDKMNEAARMIRDYYGRPTDMFVSTMVMQDVQALLRDRIRFGTGLQTGSGIFKTYPTPFGEFSLVDDVFIKEGSVPVAGSATALSALRPGAPSITDGSITTPADGASQFGVADAGNYWYKIAGVNQYGEGPADTTVAAVTLVAGDKAVIPVVNGTPVATAYRVYRSKLGAADATDCRYMFTMAVAANVEDYNSFLPGCSDVYLLNMDPVYDAIEWVQFLPALKFDLYPTNAAVFPFLCLLFGSLAVKKKQQHVRIKNVAPVTLGWF